MNRFGAFAIHLGISLVIFIILGYLILFHWYPDFFFASDGGWQGVRIVAFVDFVLGPVLTLVVFNAAKPKAELRRDLSIIGLIQAVCLTAGVWVVHSERPVAMVFTDGWFHSVSRGDFEGAGLTMPDLSGYEDRGPAWVTVDLSMSIEESQAILRSALEAKLPKALLSDFYREFRFEDIDPDSHGLPLEEVVSRDQITPFLEAFLEQNGGGVEDYLYLPFGTRFALALLAIEPGTTDLRFISVPIPEEAEQPEE